MIIVFAENLRVIFQFEFKFRYNASEIEKKNILWLLGINLVIKRIHSNDSINSKGKPSSVININQISTSIKENPQNTIWKIAEIKIFTHMIGIYFCLSY